MNDLTHLDLFSGIGGFALAARNTGFRTVGFSEVEPYACRVLDERFPGVPNLGDVKRTDAFTGLGRVTVLTGGYPCQPFSLAGKRGGASDDRHLWPAMRDVIEAVRPTWVIAENVSGHVTMGLDSVLADLEGRGYSTQPFIVPACAVDAKHRRDRLWIIGYADSHRQPDESSNAEMAELCALGDTPSRKDHRRNRGGVEQAASGREGFDHATDFAGQNVADSMLNDEQGKQSGGSNTQKRKESCKRPAGSCRNGVSWWLPEPSVGRVADGIPNRAHRLKGLGNAIVPAVVEPFFEWIAAIERGEIT